MIYVWADTHFNHTAILKYCPTRPYYTVEQMNEGLIGRWNASVGPTDTIWFLGDFGFSHSQATPLGEVFERLNGHKHLVVGNHDEKNPRVLKLPWKSIEKLVTIKSDGMRAELCHYPLETWKRAQYGALMLHGHCHGTLKRSLPHRFDVGADVEQYPVLLEDVAGRAASQIYAPADHHGDA